MHPNRTEPMRSSSSSAWLLRLFFVSAVVVQGQLEPQYIPGAAADSVTCYPADNLAWRSIPGKMIVHGGEFKPKPKKQLPPPPPADTTPVEVGPAGDVEPEPTPVDIKGPPVRLPPIAEVERQAVDVAEEAVVEKIENVPPPHQMTEDELEAEDKARTIARQSLYASIQLKGLNWFGLDRINIFEGTNYKNIDEVIEFFVAHKINAIRLPFSLEFALSPMDVEEEEAGGGRGELQYPDREKISPLYYGLTSWEIVDLLFDKARDNGILILLDMHTLDPTKGVSRLWYDPEKYSEAMVMWGWQRIIMRYMGHWNLFAVDIMNECHDHASWGKGDPLTDFNRYVERFMLFINKEVPQFKGLFFVEGIFLNGMGRETSPWPFWWGGNLFGADKFPIWVDNKELNDRIVYAPHIYGPDVFDMDYFKTWDFPNNLNTVWDNQYGWLLKKLGKAMVVGEWGGSLNGKDATVQQKLAEWMIDHCFQSNFWWALNPGSEDTDGLMSQDWERYDERKMKLLDFAQPDPSQFTYDKATNMVCVRHGSPANPMCKDDPLNAGGGGRGGWGGYYQEALQGGLARLRGSV